VADATAAVRAALRAADPGLPVAGLRPLSWLVERAVASRRLVLGLLAGFAAFSPTIP
jgi:hypothetical protein